MQSLKAKNGGGLWAGKFEIKKSSNGQFFFNLAGNGEKILTSEMYTANSSAEGGIESARKNSAIDARYERKTSKDGQPYFVLKAANSEAIGKSETYS